MEFEFYFKTPVARQHDNFYIHTFIYIHSAKINQHLMHGTFTEGLKLVPEIEKKLNEYSLFVDRHRILVFNYRIATLYFGSGDYSKAIDYLQKIIHGSDDLRIDLQCYSRLLHLLSHYELGNDEIIESLSKSTYRFMAKMKNLTVVEEEMFRFLRKTFYLNPRELKPEFEIFLNKIKHLEKNRFESRSFTYLDIISWLESKVHKKPMSEIIYQKFIKSKHRN
jgi:tetratricopeptide (TPR) repeat protein